MPTSQHKSTRSPDQKLNRTRRAQEDLNFLPPHHVRTSAAGNYFTVTTSSDNSQIYLQDDLQPQDLSAKVINPPNEDSKHKRRLSYSKAEPNDSSNPQSRLPNGLVIKQQHYPSQTKHTKVTGLALGKALAHISSEDGVPIQIAPHSAKASLSSNYKPYELIHRTDPKTKLKQAVSQFVDNYSHRNYNQSENKPLLTAEEREKKEILLAQFRSERRNRVRSAIADELQEIKTRLKLISATDIIASEGMYLCSLLY